ncbi:RNA polymerase sigma factor, sigma-70 family [[Clostridium] symbiosum]|nr:sigma-70 family RNA polymerase sigma factor [[Clostridium] symbiosum]SUY55983.1 RNA polymerase sigma factor, sigma-70 family [[Clostridium] symbiosum]
MQSMSNEQLCLRAQKGDDTARDLLLENNLGFIRKTATELYQSMALAETELAIDRDDLEQEGCIGLLNAIGSFDTDRGSKFLTYAAPSIRNAMMDLIRAGFSQFEQQVADDKNGLGFRFVRLDEILSDEERLQRIEAIADPLAKSPERIVTEQETYRELYDALDKLSPREQTYLLYRYGFTDGMEHPLIGTALHFHLSESRAKRTEETAMDNLWLELPWWF